MQTTIYGNLSALAEDGSKEAELYLALSDIENKNFQNAEHRLENLSLDDNLGHWLDWAKSQVAFQNKKYDTALTYLARLLEENPLFYSAYPLLLETLYNLGEFEMARELSSFVINSLPGYFDPVTFESKARNLKEITGDNGSPDLDIDNTGVTVDDDLDQIIEEIEKGDLDKFSEADTTSDDAEFGSVMSEIYSQSSSEDTLSPAQEGPDKEKELNLGGLIEKTLNGNSEAINESLKSPAVANEDEQKGDKKRIVSKTLGEIYASQGQIKESIKVFEKLLEQNPDDESIKRKISELKKL